MKTGSNRFASFTDGVYGLYANLYDFIGITRVGETHAYLCRIYLLCSLIVLNLVFNLFPFIYLIY